MPRNDDPHRLHADIRRLYEFAAELAYLPEDAAAQFRYRRDQLEPGARAAYLEKVTARLKHARTKGLRVPYDERDKEELPKDEEE